MYLDEFFCYKNQLMEDLLTNERIVKLINEDVDLEDAGSLMYTQVFPYEYLPETVEHGHTYICADVDIQSVQNKTYYEVAATGRWGPDGQACARDCKVFMRKQAIRAWRTRLAICEAIRANDRL